MKNRILLGIKVFGIFFLLLGVLQLIFLFLTPFISLPNPPMSISEHYMSDIPFFLFSALLFAASIGILCLNRWGRLLIVILSTIWLARTLYHLYMFFKGTFFFEPFILCIITFFIFPVIVSILAIVFLSNSKVKAQFK